MTTRPKKQIYISVEDDFLHRLAVGKVITQDEYDQMTLTLAAEVLAAALAKRFEATQETRLLIEAANLYLQLKMYFPALEICSRAPNLQGLQHIIQTILPILRQDYPGINLLGKLTSEALLVIDLREGRFTRFPPIMPVMESTEVLDNFGA